MSIGLALAILVCIVCSTYLYNDYKKGHQKDTISDSEIDSNNLISILKFGFLGGLASFLLFIILQNITKGTDVQSFILIGVIVISCIICACSAWIVQKIK